MKPEIDYWILMFKSLGMLCIVLGVLIAILYMIKRFSSNKWNSSPGMIKMLATHYIAPKEKILLLEVLGKKILIGATSQTINTLAIIDGEIEEVEKKEGSGFFEGFLKKAVQKNSGQDLKKEISEDKREDS